MFEPWRDICEGKWFATYYPSDDNVASGISSLEGKCDQVNPITQENWTILQVAKLLIMIWFADRTKMFVDRMKTH